MFTIASTMSATNRSDRRSGTEDEGDAAVGDSIWADGEQSTIPQLFARRMESNPDGEYLDICGVKLTGADR